MFRIIYEYKRSIRIHSVNVFEIEPHFAAKNGTRNTAPNDFRIKQTLSLTSKPDIELYDYSRGENVDGHLPPIHRFTRLHPKNLTEQLDRLLSHIIEQKREQNIITAFAEVDAAISDIRLGAQGAIYCAGVWGYLNLIEILKTLTTKSMIPTWIGLV
jgi:hypothetical protein